MQDKTFIQLLGQLQAWIDDHPTGKSVGIADRNELIAIKNELLEKGAYEAVPEIAEALNLYLKNSQNNNELYEIIRAMDVKIIAKLINRSVYTVYRKIREKSFEKEEIKKIEEYLKKVGK